MKTNKYIREFSDLTLQDIAIVGGKNASLGEMIRGLKSKGITIPDGFATTVTLFNDFIESTGLEKAIGEILSLYQAKKIGLQQTGSRIRSKILDSNFPEELKTPILDAYKSLSARENEANINVAVRSSATAEDLPSTSFAGQQESFLNIHGGQALIKSIQACFASLYTDRAIYYREEHGFEHSKVYLSIGVQKMIRSDKGSSGVMFTIDTDTGFPDLILINANWGLGESVVGGLTDPDEYRIYKPLLDKPDVIPIIEKKCGNKEIKTIYSQSKDTGTENIQCTSSEKGNFVLSDSEIVKLARWARLIEDHYKRPMDIEWAKDGISDKLYCVQARPETVQSRTRTTSFESFKIENPPPPILSGIAIGQSIVKGNAKLIQSPTEMYQLEQGDILITEKTDPDWVPIMKKAGGIITDHGGRTSHAAIVSRELGIPAVVGTGNATKHIANNQLITLSCAEGETGRIYEGEIRFRKTCVKFEDIPKPPVDLMINLADPAAAFRWWRLPIKGVGLARMEFVIGHSIKIHPLALARYEQLDDDQTKVKINDITIAYADKKKYFIEQLARGIASLAASQYPKPCIVRLSDFKTNEYAKLIGGQWFESPEENPMIGFRGASRYYDEDFEDAFRLECSAIKFARKTIGFDNIIIMIPFVRTLIEADKVLALLEKNDLVRGEDGLKIYMMCEIPSNALLAESFAKKFDGFSIGSNDLTQLVLGVDRDSEKLKSLFNETDEAVIKAITMIINCAHKMDIKVGICGQAPSDYPDFAKRLISLGIDSISLTPDSVINVINHISISTHQQSIA